MSALHLVAAWPADHVAAATADHPVVAVRAVQHIVSVPADELRIENYQQVDGVISFDYTFKISKYRGVLGLYDYGFTRHGMNTTAHDITITGTFTSGQSVYTDVVGRKRG